MGSFKPSQDWGVKNATLVRGQTCGVTFAGATFKPRMGNAGYDFKAQGEGQDASSFAAAKTPTKPDSSPATSSPSHCHGLFPARFASLVNAVVL